MRGSQKWAYPGRLLLGQSLHPQGSSSPCPIGTPLQFAKGPRLHIPLLEICK